MKNKYFISGLIILIISSIIYLTKGNPYWGDLDYAANDEKFLLHLFWSQITSYVGFGLIFVGIIKYKSND